MVKTGASSYIKYGWETQFGVSPGDSALDKVFGLNARLTNWSLTHSPKDLPTLGQVEVKDYAYGQQAGSMGIDFVLSNPWIFKSVYGNPAKTGSTAPFTYKYGTALGTNSGNHAGAKSVQNLTVEVGFQGETDSVVRRGLGCIVNSLNISTTIDGTVDCSTDIGYGKEDANSGAVYNATFDTTPPTEDVGFPYTFAHGEIRWAGEGGADTDASGSVVAELQDASISFAQNPALLYTIGQHQAVASFRRVFDVTGSFRASWKNDDKLNQLFDQVRKPLTKSTISTNAAKADIILSFKNQAATSSTMEVITMKLNGVRPDSHAVEGIVPVEPVFENIAWRTKNVEIICENSVNRSSPF